MRCYTTYKENILESDQATSLYLFLQDSIEWEDGVKSKKGYTRKAKPLDIGDIPEVDHAIIESLSKLTTTKYTILGVYLNYYQDGNMWTPNHSHKGTHQLVISLGQTRQLDVSKKSYKMANGSAILFGGSIHGVPKDTNITEGRISIATFMIPV